MPTKIEITHKTILFTLGVLVLGWFLLAIKEIILILFLAFILMSALRPMVEKLKSWRFPHAIAILVVYLFFLFCVAILGGVIFPPLIMQTVKFWENLPGIANSLLPFMPLNLDIIFQQITPLGGNVLKVAVSFFSNIITILTIFVLSFYLLVERDHFEDAIKSFIGEKNGGKIVSLFRKIEEKLGLWIRGQLFLMLIIGVFIYLGLLILGVEYALPLAITAGLLEIVPLVGSIISAVPAILVALTVSPILALTVGIMYFIVNQSEGSFIVPTVMRKAVGLPAIVILLALMIGGKLAGISGALLAIPTVVVLQVILSEISSEKK